MDSITHAVLGAVSSDAIAGRKIGKRALLYGALAQNLPDVDVIASLWLSPADNLLAHRGITHSLSFLVLASVALAWLSHRVDKTKVMPFRDWVFFYALQLLFHLVLDICNAYGIGLLEPFSHTRFSFQTLFVADPFFTIPLLIATITLIFLHRTNALRRSLAYISIALSMLYVGYAFVNKRKIESDIAGAIVDQKIDASRILTTPTPLNVWLWFTAVETPDGFFIGHRSVWDNENKPIVFSFFPRNDSLLTPFRNLHDTEELIRFSHGFYTVEKEDSIVSFNDLRFGQTGGWTNPRAPFTFHYYLNDPQANMTVMQRGRFSHWNKKTFQDFIDRIRGH